MLPSDGLCLNASKTASSPLNITISRVHTLVIHPWQVYASIHEYGLIGCRWCQRSTLPSPVNTTHAGRVHQTVCKRLSLWVGVLYSCEQLNTASGWDSSLDLKVCSLWRTLSFRSLFYKYFLLENPCGSLIFFFKVRVIYRFLFRFFNFYTLLWIFDSQHSFKSTLKRLKHFACNYPPSFSFATLLPSEYKNA